MAWEPAKYLTAVTYAAEPQEVVGYTYRGLGLKMVMKGSPKGRRPPTWSLTHLGSGHRVALIDGTVADAFPIASEIAECSEWDFDGLNGWINRDRELPTKVQAIIAKHGKRCRGGSGGHSETQARAVAMARA